MVRIEDFEAGRSAKTLGYRAFVPQPINTTYSWNDSELTRLAEQAALRIGQLDAYADLVPNVDHFIRMHIAKEATLSSRIEGTQTIIEEALLKERNIDPGRKDDWKEVNNYVRAMNKSITELQRLPLSTRILKQAHKTLLTHARGAHKLPGEFRTSQNWIGGSNPGNAVFVPPPWQEVDALMSDLEKFIHNDETGLTHLLKIALAHYQFETIHPFLDGNGRIGRMMITLYLVENQILRKPALYLSDFFEKQRSAYYEYLTRVRTHNDLMRWMKFFLSGVMQTSEDAIRALKDILALKSDCEEKRIYKLGRKVSSAKRLLDYLYRQPILDADEVAKVMGLSMVSSYKLIGDFIKLGILVELTGSRRNRIFAFKEYFEIFKK